MNTFLSFSQLIKKQNIHQSKTALTTYKQHMTSTFGSWSNEKKAMTSPVFMYSCPSPWGSCQKKYNSEHLTLLFFYLMFIFKSLSFCWAEWSLSSVCWTSFPITCVLDRKASTSLRSRISGFNPLSLVSVTSFEKTFKKPKTQLTR